jgi:lipoprotein-anchoring transpeptidase ErfK/SrfK
MRKEMFWAACAALGSALVVQPAIAAGEAAAQKKGKSVKTAMLAPVKAPVAKPAIGDVANAGKAEKAARKPAARKRRRHARRERLVAKIDLTRQRMKVMVDGKVKYSWKISSGAKGYHTPTGSYKPYYMTSMHYSRKYNNAPMPHAIFFRGGFAIHATGSISRLGSPASHGCIRLHPANARKLFRLVSKYKKAGTRIRISGVTPATHYRKRYASRRKTRAARRNFWVSQGGLGSSMYGSSYRRRISIRRQRSRIYSWNY